MIISPPDTAFFTILGLNIHFYSLVILTGIAVSLFWALYLIKKIPLPVDKEIFLDFTPFLIIVAVLGARAYYVLLSLDYFLKHPMEIFMIWNGGIAIHGAIVAGIIFGIFYFKNKKLPFFPYADVFTLVLPLGQAIGRWGNFFNSEAFGAPVLNGAPVLLYVKKALRPFQYADFEYFHPAFLYESILDFIIFLILLFAIKKTANKIDGFVFFLYILLYSTVRSMLEFLRLDTVFYLFNIPFPSLVSAFGILIGLVGIFWRVKAK